MSFKLPRTKECFETKITRPPGREISGELLNQLAAAARDLWSRKFYGAWERELDREMGGVLAMGLMITSILVRRDDKNTDLWWRRRWWECRGRPVVAAVVVAVLFGPGVFPLLRGHEEG